MPIITKSVVFNNNAPVGCPPGGTEDQLLAKNSNLNFDYKWIDPPAEVPISTVKTFVGNFSQVSGGTVTQLNTTQPDALTGIVWTFGAGPGWYIGTKAGAFPDNTKVFVTSDITADSGFFYIVTQPNQITIESLGLGPVQGNLKIEVYP